MATDATRRAIKRTLSRCWLLGLAALISGCAGSGAAVDEGLSAEGFVAVYVELRVAALKQPSGEIPVEERDRILAGHGLTEEDLLTFVELHGRDVEYMNGLWDDVEAELEAAGEMDSVSAPS